MKTNFLFFFFAFSALVFIISSCEKENEENISKNGEARSHNMGQNCMNCHKNGGTGEGIFTIAGTAYDTTLTNTIVNGNVEFYDAPSGGNLVATLEIDANGNFFTTTDINIGNGLYPKVISANGNSQMMGSAFTGGGCASCHGSNRDVIWVQN